MHVEVLSQQGEALADGVVSALVGTEVGSQFLRFGGAVLLRNDSLLSEDDGLRPLI